MSITMIGLDTAKAVFQVHALNLGGKAVSTHKLRRDQIVPFFERLEACTVVMEACGAAHHWGRLLSGLGHDVRLIPSEAVRPFVKRGRKNDAADAAAICEAASRPNIKFVPVKSLEQQGILALHSARTRLVKQQTMLANAMRGLATTSRLRPWEIMSASSAGGALRTATGVSRCDRNRPISAGQSIGGWFCGNWPISRIANSSSK